MTKLMKISYGKEEYHQELSKNQSKMKLTKTIKCFYFSEKKKKKIINYFFCYTNIFFPENIWSIDTVIVLCQGIKKTCTMENIEN